MYFLHGAVRNCCRTLHRLLMMVTQKVSGKRRLVSNGQVRNERENAEGSDVEIIKKASEETKVEGRTRRWGQARNGPPRTWTNKFGPLTLSFFYPLLGGFVKSKENTSIWDQHGATLLSKVFLTLSCFLQCSGLYPGSTVLAHDLLAVVWPFRYAESGEVRQAVLVALGTCVAFLSSEEVMRVIFDREDVIGFLVRTSNEDPDYECRKLSFEMSKAVHSAMSVIQQGGSLIEPSSHKLLS